MDSNYQDPNYPENPAQGAAYFNSCSPIGTNTYQLWVDNDDGTIRDLQTGKCLDSNYSNPANPSVGAVYTLPCNLGNNGYSSNQYQQWFFLTAP